MTNELLYFMTLKKIARGYMTTEQLKSRAGKEYGVSYHEALEMAYDNIQAEAAAATHGKRRPRDPLQKSPARPSGQVTTSQQTP